jgi:hypothetical protein
MQEKPARCCHPDCYNCPYDECIYDGYEDDETNAIDKSVKKFAMLQRALFNGSEKSFRCNHSEKGKAAQKRYIQSEKGKAAQKRYAQSDRGKKMQRRKAKRRWQKELERRDMEKWKQEVREYNKMHRYEN